ncbi:DUF202 domain-containing protein [Candidatus Dependentiae bacterium]
MKKDDIKNNLDKLNSLEVIEQTFLSWVQTGLTLIGIGFGVGGILSAMKVHHYQKTSITTIKIVGLLLIFVGLIAIILSLIQHKIKLQEIKAEKYPTKKIANLPLFIGIILIFLGLAAFGAILMHLIH